MTREGLKEFFRSTYSENGTFNVPLDDYFDVYIEPLLLKATVKPSEKDVEHLKEMFDLQAKLNEHVFKENNIENYEAIERNIDLAILDEVGELNHEMKSDWCWWKKTQKEKDMAKVLEEWVDVVHFILSKIIATDFIDEFINDFKLGYFKDNEDQANLYEYLGMLTCGEGLLEVTHYLGFDFDDVYQAYIKKNKTNHERQDNGY